MRLSAMVAGVVLMTAGPLLAGTASGTLTYKGKKGPVVVAVKHAYLVKGPDAVSGKTIRRVVLSSADVAAALAKCDRMMCADGGIGEGMTVDLDAGPRLNYWFVANDQMVQYSGSAAPASLKLKTDTASRLAGAWDLDDSAAGGVAIKVEFDAELVKDLKK